MAQPGSSGSRTPTSSGWWRRSASPTARVPSCSTEALGNGATVGVLHQPSEFVAHPQTRHARFFADTGVDGLEGSRSRRNR